MWESFKVFTLFVNSWFSIGSIYHLLSLMISNTCVLCQWVSKLTRFSLEAGVLDMYYFLEIMEISMPKNVDWLFDSHCEENNIRIGHIFTNFLH